jgi:hypothetical protein
MNAPGMGVDDFLNHINKHLNLCNHPDKFAHWRLVIAPNPNDHQLTPTDYHPSHIDANPRTVLTIPSQAPHKQRREVHGPSQPIDGEKSLTCQVA